MSQYKIALSGAKVVTLFENGNAMYAVDHGECARSFHFVDDLSKTDDSANSFKPTMGFWKELVKVNKYTATLSAEIRHLNLSDEAVPDNEHWGLPYQKQIPRYEARLAYELASRLLELRQETRTVFKEYPSLRRLFRHAHVEATGEAPEYLRDFVN